MIPIKTELNFNLYTITDLSSKARNLVSAFTRFTKNVRIQNVNRPEEKIILFFPSEKFLVAIDWTSLAIQIEGERVDLKEFDGQFRFFYEIFEKLKQLDSFNGFKSISIDMWDLIDNRYNDYPDFKETFLSNEVPNNLPVNDVSLLIQGDYKEKDIEYTCNFGPFDYPQDITNHNLKVFDRDLFQEADLPQKGLLVNTNATSKSEEFDFSVVEDLFSVKTKMKKALEK